MDHEPEHGRQAPTYEAPQVTDHGSIADHTFGVPGRAGIITLVRVDVDLQVLHGYAPAAQLARPGHTAITDTAGPAPRQARSQQSDDALFV